KIEELVEEVKRGLYLFETIGTWLSNPISGDLSATATNAFLIENGVLTKPVKGVIVSGNFFDILLGKIDVIADDIWNLGSTYSPSIRVSEMMVTGQ
ncbi:metallopeptidase TldD-related protein, partial [Candidatus Bathyarchaeota archaeon]|nr:metallopeptidase TldD-related protein [Candidatus Bathyarchaeota archaeon]